jgi:hypothetical protein
MSLLHQTESSITNLFLLILLIILLDGFINFIPSFLEFRPRLRAKADFREGVNESEYSTYELYGVGCMGGGRSDYVEDYVFLPVRRGDWEEGSVSRLVGYLLGTLINKEGEDVDGTTS